MDPVVKPRGDIV
ncbi:MAG: hypothetical protein LN589_05805 [Rickettsia endosymbiont of Eriopis connexa]|nr:hypothetical protein [Rickettsia endosymbiont of Eriopis connexa]